MNPIEATFICTVIAIILAAFVALFDMAGTMIDCANDKKARKARLKHDDNLHFVFIPWSLRCQHLRNKKGVKL
jgi:hypothetical protein